MVIGVALPAAAGLALGSIWKRKRLARRVYRAWDYRLAEGNLFVKVRTVSGSWLGGSFGDDSFAGAFPHAADLYLEVAYEMSDDGEFGRPRDYAIYVPADRIDWLEFPSPTEE